MSSCFIKMLYALALLLFYFAGFIDGFNLGKNGEIKCIEMERQALLKFMQGLHDRTGMMLSTWRDGGDCCEWKGIECNNQTGHLQKLDLRGNDRQSLMGVINFTSLIELQEMEYLDLSNNFFPFSHISEFVGLFTKLRYLNLSDSYFGGRIPSTLGELTHLTYLDLRSNFLYGGFPSQLGNLSQLQYLALEGNSLSGAIPFQTGNLPLLHTLRLDGVNTINAEWLSTLSSLTNLALGGSFLDSGSSRNCLQAINKLIPNLRELRLVGCGLSDNDTASLFHSHDSNSSTSLTILDLSSNMLKSSSFQFLSNFRLNNLQELYLSNNSIVLPYPLYANFPSLVILDLSYNNLSSSKFQGNFNFGSSKLQQLRLINCSLMDASFHVSSSVSIVNSSSSLVVLDLSSNLLRSSDVFYWIFNFTTNLRTLNLDGNLLEGPILDGFGKGMNSLEVLDLSFNKLQHEIPAFFGNMCTLQSLDLSDNNLTGEISSFIQNSSWCNRHIFRMLDLSSNRITGMIPESISLLSELELLALDGNHLEGDVTESHLTNFSKLQGLLLSYNSLSVKLSSSWIPPFQLVFLGLGSCKLGLSFPIWIHTQRSLQYLDISNAGLNGTIPEWLWNNSQYIQLMNMSYNKFIGAIPNLPFRFLYKPSILLNSNQLEGAVPSFLRQASKLILSANKFSNLFSLLCDKGLPGANLATLDLSNNQIKRQLPDCWKSVSTLLFLDLRNNELSGKIPRSMGTLVKLEALVLQNNSLKGELPATLKNCGNLMLLDVGENLLSGPVPSWIGENLQQLIMLRMKGNRFSGIIPLQLCYLRYIQLLDLSRNKLSKGIPTCIKNFTAMSKKSVDSSEIRSKIVWSYYVLLDMYVSINADYQYQLNVTMMWKGMEYGIKDPDLRVIIDLSNNDLTGEIPKEVGYLHGLNSLNLSTNNLSGEIPFEIGNLILLESLDLSRNHFSGKIPLSLSQIDNLGKVNLSYNSLSGRIPQGRHFQTFDASSFEGNPDLCGEVQLNKSCPGDRTLEKPQQPIIHGGNDNSDFYEGLYMSLGLGYFIGFWGLIGPILLWRPWRIAYVRFLKRLEDYIYVMVAMNMARWQR